MESNDTMTFDLEWHWKVKVRSLRFRSFVSCKGAELGHMLLLSLNRKAYMGSPMTLSHLTLNDLERSVARSFGFQRLIFCKAAELGHMLLLNTDRTWYIGCPKSPSHLTLSDLKRSKIRCRIWSEIDTCIVRYCVRVDSVRLSSRVPRYMDLLIVRCTIWNRKVCYHSVVVTCLDKQLKYG